MGKARRWEQKRKCFFVVFLLIVFSTFLISFGGSTEHLSPSALRICFPSNVPSLTYSYSTKTMILLLSPLSPPSHSSPSPSPSLPPYLSESTSFYSHSLILLSDFYVFHPPFLETGRGVEIDEWRKGWIGWWIGNSGRIFFSGRRETG